MTDAELAGIKSRLKDYRKKDTIKEVAYTLAVMDALMARLAAAEALCEDHSTDTEYDMHSLAWKQHSKLLAAWRKERETVCG